MITLIFLFLLPIFLSVYSMREVLLFRPDKHNPYVRHCRKCGQMQVEMCWSLEDWNRPCWWENRCSVYNENCKCHKYSDYRK